MFEKYNPSRGKKGQASSVEPSSSGDSYVEKVGTNVAKEGETMIAPVKGAFDNVSKTMDNTKASPETKAVAVGLAVAEGGMAMAGNIMGATTKLTEAALMPVMQQLSFLRGLACLPVLKQTDPVVGIDVHNVNIPPSPIVPMPHPYIAMLFRPKDFMACALLSVIPTPPPPPDVNEQSEDSEMAAANEAKALNMAHMAATMAIGMLGASVKLGDFLPRAVSGTIGQQVPHIPMGVGFSAPFIPIEKDQGHSFLGSLFVNADCDPLSGALGHLHNDCWDVGVKNLHGEEGVPKGMRLYVPSGLQTSIPMGKQVLVNPIPTPMNPTSAVKKFLKGGLGKLGKKVRKGVESLINKAKNTKLGSKLGCPFYTKVSKLAGQAVSHPVDVSSGHFFTDETDFSLPGIIPVQFERTYYSYSDYKGPLGTGWHHTYDMALALDQESGLAALRMADGRMTPFEIPAKGSSFFNRREKLTLHHTAEDTYYISDTHGLIYNFTKEEYRNPFNKTESHLLKSICNLNGHTIRFTYDRNGILTQMIDSAGRPVTFRNDGKGHITEIYIPDAETGQEQVLASSYEYDTEGRLVKQTDALGNSMTFAYDGTLMTRETWRNGLSWHIRYKGAGIHAKSVEITGDNNLMHYTLNYVDEGCTVVTDSLGNTTTYYHKNGLVVKRVEPNSGEYVFRYNNENELEWAVDPLGNGSGSTHDEWGNMVTKTEADGGFIHLKYENSDFFYLPTSAVDAAGGRWAWAYDDQGNLIKRIDPVGAETTFTYEDGLLTIITGAEGQQTRLEYNAQGNLIRAIAPDGGVNQWDYDCLGQCLRYENAKEGVTQYTYNILGDITEVKEPDGNIRELTYDMMGNVLHAKDSDRDVHFTYQGVNKLASRTERGATLRFLYDTEDQLRAVENEKGERYSFRIDCQGDVVQETGFDGLTRHYTRDLAGQVLCVKRPNKKEIAYEYDPVGRVTKIIYNPNEKDRAEETYEYRTDGALLKATNKDSVVELKRDILGRVTKEITNGNEINSFYDKSGNRVQITSGLGADIQARYNLMGDLLSLSNGGWQTQYQRDLFGLETERTLLGGVKTRTTRDRLGRVTGHKIEKNNHKLNEKDYLWGTNDKLLSVISNGKTTHFEYDGWGNLSKTIFEDGKTELRNPDKTGNLFESLDRMDRKYAKGGQLLKTERWEYKYDTEGNLIRKKDKHGATWRYEWNEAGMLKCVKRPDGAEVSFKYDALGRRIEKRFGRYVTTWIWDGNVPLHEQKEIHTQDYNEENGYFTHVESQPLITWVFEEGTFVPTAKLTEKKQLSIVTNYLGTPESMYQEDGETVWTCELNSYGKVRNFQGQSKTDCPFRYQGQYEDAETGLYYNRFRYYSPEEGMYLSQDPIRLDSGTQLYSYVHDTNDYIDVFGLSGQRWKGKTKKDGTPYKKPGPKTKGTGAHNAKIEEIINRESAKPGVTHIGGGSKTEIIIDTAGGNKPSRRMDASFQRADKSIYHINVGRTLEDGKTGIKRERLALDDVLDKGHDASFEGYGKDSDFKSKKASCKKNNS